MPLKVQPDEPLTLNLTSMIDVVLLLVIFFMVGTRFTSHEQKIDVRVPQVGNTKGLAPTPEKKAIHIFQDGRLALGEEFLADRQLKERLANDARQNPRLAVIVRGDAEVSLQRFAEVLATCREAGVHDVGVSVRVARRE